MNDDRTKAPRPPRGTWMPIAKWRGMGIYLDPILLVLLALLVVMGTEAGEAVARLVLGAVLVASVLVHELGHALVARLRGLAVSGIYLHLVPFAYVERGAPADEWRVALGGPLLSLILGALLSLGVYATEGASAFGMRDWLSTPLYFGVVINLAMGVINLVPALPLDGGRALRAVLQTRLSRPSAARWSATAGTVVGVALAVWGLSAFVLPESGYLCLLGTYFCLTALRQMQGAEGESTA